MKLLLALLLSASLLLGSSCVPQNVAVTTPPYDVRDQVARAVVVQVRGAAVALQGEKGKIVPIKQSGSGVVIDSERVLTAAHVCRVEHPGGSGMVAFRIFVLGDDAIVRHAKVLKRDDAAELCLLSVPGMPSSLIRLAGMQPPVGAPVTYFGAPVGSFRPGEPFIGDGRSIGRRQFQDRLWEAYSFPAVGGASGSGIYWEGRLCGILTAASSTFHHSTLASSLDQVRKFLGRRD